MSVSASDVQTALANLIQLQQDQTNKRQVATDADAAAVAADAAAGAADQALQQGFADFTTTVHEFVFGSPAAAAKKA